MTSKSIEVKHVGRDQGEAKPSPTKWSYRPAVDIFETDEETIIVADLPGAKADGLDVRYEENHLSLHARVPERPHAGRSELVHEFGVGDFDREFSLAIPVDAGRIRAEFGLGTLTVHLPKPERAKPRRIQVKET